MEDIGGLEDEPEEGMTYIYDEDDDMSDEGDEVDHDDIEEDEEEDDDYEDMDEDEDVDFDDHNDDEDEEGEGEDSEEEQDDGQLFSALFGGKAKLKATYRLCICNNISVG